MIDFLIISILVFLNGFFSLAEVSLITARKVRLKNLAKQGNRSAQQALDLMANPDNFIATAQLGITVVSILTGIYSGEALSGDFANLLMQGGVPEGVAPMLSKTIIVIVATYIQCELGEIFPKRLALSKADTMAVWSAPLMVVLGWISFPLNWLMKRNTNFLMKFFHLKEDDKRVTEEEVKSVIREGTSSGEVQEVEQEIMERAFILGDLRVEAIMTPRNELEMFDINFTADEIRKVMAKNVHNIYPVVDGSMDNILGYVALKDLVFSLNAPDFHLKKHMNKPLFIPESMTVYRALEKLKEHKIGRALVCDEYGSVQGMLSYKDIFEGLVGTLPNTSDKPDIIERSDKKSYIVDGGCLFYDFVDYFDCVDFYTSEYNTVAGLILSELGSIPKSGETLIWHTLQIKVLQVINNRIDKVLVTYLEEEAEKEEK